MTQYTRHRFRKNVPGLFYTTGDCMACDAPEHEALDLLEPLIGCNYDTSFIRQPSTPDEVERACRALEVCCVAALRYGGSDPHFIRGLGNEADYCDRLLPGGPIPRPDWLTKQSPSSGADERREKAAFPSLWKTRPVTLPSMNVSKRTAALPRSSIITSSNFFSPA